MSKILIVVDMQNDFVDGSLGTKQAVKIVDRVVNKIKNHDGIVLFTRDTHKPDYLDTMEGKKLPVEHCIVNTPGREIIDSIKETDAYFDDYVFDKNTFGSTKLIDYLVEHEKTDGITSFELAGLCTDICVISNALAIKAYFPETPIFVDASCCAGVTPESHENALSAMAMCHIDILNR